ncbi:GNAT family N-acetyltransferase [Streptomyces sp. NPDC016566]|uniref:GNAT family N-acetyltransferase n=1 Tax=Streptomyces sp. NPDC016566 TaxID=3364967 RepID=UPI0036FB8B86
MTPGLETPAADGFQLRRTERLELHALAMEHVGPVHSVYGDPATWSHLPQGRHATHRATAAMITKAEAGWHEHGLGYWSVLLRAPLAGCSLRPGDIIGTGGVSVVDGDVWNLGYRLTPEVWGRGLAGEVVSEALACALAVAPDRPVVARILSENTASRRVVERAGLVLLREETDRSGPAVGRRRLIFSDRQVP